VDFKLRMRAGQPTLELLETRRGGGGGGGQAERARGYHALPGARVEFPDGQDPADYDQKVVECSYDKDRDAWLFLRCRTDKETPNAWHVYESVQRSIEASRRPSCLPGCLPVGRPSQRRRQVAG
jgi:mRNA-capping enzyme